MGINMDNVRVRNVSNVDGLLDRGHLECDKHVVFWGQLVMF